MRSLNNGVAKTAVGQGGSLLKLHDCQKTIKFFILKWSRTLAFCPISQFSGLLRNDHELRQPMAASSVLLPWPEAESHKTQCIFIIELAEPHTPKPFFNLNCNGTGHQWSCLHKMREKNNDHGGEITLYDHLSCQQLTACRTIIQREKVLYLLDKSETTQEVFDRRHLISSSVGHLTR